MRREFAQQFADRDPASPSTINCIHTKFELAESVADNYRENAGGPEQA